MDLKKAEAALLAAEKAGDVGAATAIATEMRRFLQTQDPSLGMPEKIKLGQEGMPDAIRSVAKEQFGTAGQLFAGAGSAPVLAGQGLAGLVGQENPQTIQNWRAVQRATPATLGGNIMGNVGMFGVAPTQLGAGGIRVGAGAMGVKAPGMISSRPWMVGDTVASSGVLNAAVEPGTPQDRAMAGIWALGSSAAVPGAYALGAGGRRMLTSGGKRIQVGEGLRAELGEEGTQRLSAGLTGPDRAQGLLGVRSSAAVRTGEPTLEALESGSRATRGDLWRTFDQDNARARWDALNTRAGTAEELDALKRNRDLTTGASRDEALTDAQITAQMTLGNPVSEQILRPITSKLNDIRTGSSRPNKNAQTLADYVEGQLREGVTPEQLYTIRKELTDGVAKGRNDELSNAIKAARGERMSLVSMIDDALDELSGGSWRSYLKEYAGKSLPITSKQALLDMVGALQRGQPLGEVPSAMTASWKTVGNLRDRFGQKEIGSKLFDRLEPTDRQLINTLVENLKRQSDAMTTKATLGSPTAGLLANSSRAQNITQGLLGAKAAALIPGGGLLTGAAFDNLGRKAETELARLLQNPEELLEAIKAAERAELLRKSSSRVGAASGGAASEYPR
jgi:hypothetical protein